MAWRAALLAALTGSKPGADAASAELLSLVLQPRAASRGAAGDARVAELLAQLAAAPRPFRAAQLGGGPWQVVHTSGALAWRPLAPGSAVAAQEFDPVARTVVNSVTLFDGAVRLTAEGDFSAADTPPRAATPVRFSARIRRGALAVGALRLPLPIAGEGAFEVAYVDTRLRIFRSPTGLAVQVPQAAVRAADDEARAALRAKRGAAA